MTLESGLLIGGLLAMIGGILSLLSRRVAIPGLLLFLILGVCTGPDGLNWIPRVPPLWTHGIGTIALLLILFSGGLDTKWRDIKQAGKPAGLLATLGVAITASGMALGGMYWLNMSLQEGLLLGAILASTDAAAVFGVLRSAKIGFTPPIRSVLEIESGGNDPMAIFLTVLCIQWVSHTPTTLTIPLITSWIGSFLITMMMGSLIGIIMSQIMAWILKKWHGTYDSTIPILMIGMIGVVFGLTSLIGGSGFLAVYIAGVLLARETFAKKQFVSRFFDGLAWGMQWLVFMTLGLMVIPHSLWTLAPIGMLLTILLMLVVRPLAVWACLWPFKMPLSHIMMVSWGGLKGAAPIVLATFPYMAGLNQAPLLFHLVFFVVAASVLIQGTTIRWVATYLGVHRAAPPPRDYPLQLDTGHPLGAELSELEIPYESDWVHQSISTIGLPSHCLVVMVARDGKWTIPSAKTPIQGGDTWLILCPPVELKQVHTKLSQSTDIPLPPS